MIVIYILKCTQFSQIVVNNKIANYFVNLEVTSAKET